MFMDVLYVLLLVYTGLAEGPFVAYLTGIVVQTGRGVVCARENFERILILTPERVFWIYGNVTTLTDHIFRTNFTYFFQGCSVFKVKILGTQI